MSAALLVAALRDPGSVTALDGAGWTALVSAARAEQLIGSLAYRLDGIAMPEPAARLLADARAAAGEQRRAALWEVEMARRALAPLGVPVVLLKGSAFVAAGLAAGVGRSIGDLDILMPREALRDVEAALLAAGWDWLKPDPYDDDYNRRWMHELPPLSHRSRDRMIDVHHTILPPTARVTPDAAALVADSVTLENGLRVLSPADMLCHAAAHLFADGELAGGLRNLWDVHRLVEDGVPDDLAARAAHHGLSVEVGRGLRLANTLYRHPGPVPGSIGRQAQRSPFRAEDLRLDGPRNKSGVTQKELRPGVGLADRLYLRRLLARDGWGRATRPVTRFGFYVRSHWLRMPPAMLARHLWTKWRRSA